MKEKLDNFINNLKQVDFTKIDFSKLFDWEYLTDPYPSEGFIYEQWIYVIVLLNLFLSIAGFQFFAKRFFENKPMWRLIRKICFLWLSNSIFLLLYNLLRVEGIRFLSMRLFLVLIIFAYILILLYALFYWRVILPKRMDRFKKAKLREKYTRKKRK